MLLAGLMILPMMSVSPAVAAGEDFVGGPRLQDMPTQIPNDHTPQAIRFTASGLLPNTAYEVKIRMSPNENPSGSDNRGFTWNPNIDQWVRNRGPAWGAGNFPTVMTDATGAIAANDWFYFKFANESNSGPYYIIVTLNSGGDGEAQNAATRPLVNVLDMKTQGAWVHNGSDGVTVLEDEKRVITAPGTSTNSTGNIWSLVRTENNNVDDDSDGIVDNEGGPGDYRLAVLATATIDVWVQQNRLVNDFVMTGPDEDIALGAADTSAPTSPTVLAATPHSTGVSLSWQASTDNVGVDHYRVYRWVDVNSVEWTPPRSLIGTTTTSAFEDADAWGGVAYNYEVRAVDEATNVSQRSNTASAMVANVVPAAADDSYEVVENSVLIEDAPGVLGNDSDVNLDPLIAVLETDVQHGELVLNADGAFTYTPDPGYVGLDGFTYRAQDAVAESELAAVTIAVLPMLMEVDGPSRYETAIAASKLAYPDPLDAAGARTVVIATGANWPDALGGTSLAGALDGPVLLTRPDVLPDSVKAEIDRLDAQDAIILGGTNAVSLAVETSLKSHLGTDRVKRIQGADRYETAEKIASRVTEELGAGYDGTAFVATGFNFPDALAAAPLAAAQGWPLYLVHPTGGLSDATIAKMKADDVVRVIALGGTGVVSPAVFAKLKSEFGTGLDDVRRLEGTDRYKTAIAIASFAVDKYGHTWDRVGITTGTNFPDALAGGVAQGKRGSVLVLTAPTALSPDVAQALTDNKAAISSVTFYGGANAVSEAVRTQVRSIIE